MVAATEAMIAALERNWEMMDAALAGMDDATLAQRPTDQCNSAAWILWHMSRVVDTVVHTRLRQAPQLWITGGWHLKFGMGQDPDDRGVGWTAAQVAAWAPPSRNIQLNYYEVVKTAARAYLASLTPGDLERRLVVPPAPEPRSVAAFLGLMTWDCIAHGGQIAYLRGFYRGMGWHR